jgi:hypothetical protein
MDTNNEYLAGMRTHFKQWDEAVGVLVAEGKKASGDSRTIYERRLKELRLARSAAQRSYEAVRVAGATAAAQAQAGMQAAWETMQETLAKVSSSLHPPPAPTMPPAPEPEQGTDATDAMADTTIVR